MAKDAPALRSSSYLDEEEKGPSIIGENKKLDTSADVADIIALIKKCEGLNTLRLSGNSFGVEACEAIGDALSKIPTVRRLLWSDMFVSRLTAEIPRSLTSLGNGVVASGAQLVELDLSDNAFGLAGVNGIVSLLTSPAAFTIKVLKFNNNGLGIGGGKALAKALEDCYCEAQQAGARFALEVFVAGRNRLENDGAKALAAVFEMVGTLVQVSMPQNGITAAGITALAKAFGKNPNLQIIDLNDNTFTQDGACAMAEVLPNLQQLRVINFGDCLVRPGGALAIAEVIEDGHKLLQELNLSYCELDTDAGTAIINALSNKQDLKKVDLNGNCFGEQGVETIKEIMESKGCVEALGTLSDDEGEQSEEGEEEGNTTREEGEESKGEISEHKEDEDEGESSEHKEDEDKGESSEHKEDEGDESENQEELGSDPATITIEEYLAQPSGENLVALGSDRAEAVSSTLGSNPSVDDVASLYCKVTSSYTASESSSVKKAVQETVDAILKQHFESNSAAMLNAILVQVGLIKSEDKKFKCVKEPDGPLIALEYVIRQSYFPNDAESILIAFVNKPSPVLDKRCHIRDKLLRVLMSC